MDTRPVAVVLATVASAALLAAGCTRPDVDLSAEPGVTGEAFEPPSAAEPPSTISPLPEPELQAAIAARQAERTEAFVARADAFRAEREARQQVLMAAQEARGRLRGELVCEHPVRSWCEAAGHDLNTIAPNWQRLGWNAVVSEHAPAPGIGGTAYPAEKRFVVYPDDGWSREGFTRVLLHEFGHAIDHALWSDADRDRWRSERGIPADGPWRAGGWPHEHGAGAEDLAEAMVWFHLDTIDAVKSPYGLPEPDVAARWYELFLPETIR